MHFVFIACPYIALTHCTPQCTSVIRDACRIDRKTLKRFPHTHTHPFPPKRQATATKDYKYICHIYIQIIYIYIYLCCIYIFVSKFKLTFSPKKKKKNHIQNLYSFGFNRFLFFTPFCVLSGNLREGRRRKGCLGQPRQLLDLNSMELAIKKRANANGMEAAMAIKEFRIGNRKMEFPFIYANPFTSSGLAAFVPYLYLYQIP